MTKVLITGRPGTGKTTAIRLIAQKGVAAFNTDDIKEATCLQNIQTGEVVEWPEEEVDWTRFAWNWQRPVIEKLLEQDELVIVGGTASNQKDFYPLFDYVFVLNVSSDTLRHHLELHEHDSHHLLGVIERKVNNHDNKQSLLLAEGGVAIDGNRPTAEIVEDILSRCA